MRVIIFIIVLTTSIVTNAQTMNDTKNSRDSNQSICKYGYNSRNWKDLEAQFAPKVNLAIFRSTKPNYTNA